MKIGFIGLGNMGLPIAKNILQAGFHLQVYNRTLEKTETLKALDAQVMKDEASVANDVDIVITMLSDDNAVASVQQKILPSMKRGSIHLSMSTIAPATAEKLASECDKYSVSYLASPVMGRPPAAEAKQLFMLLSGEDGAKEKVEPVLQAISQRVFDFGNSIGAANTVKLMMNYMLFVNVEMLSEVMLTAEKSNIEKQMLLDTMLATLFGSPIVKGYGNMVVQEKDNPNGFSTKLASKDLRLMLETASSKNISLGLGEVIQKNFEEIISNNNGAKDVSLLVSHLRDVNKK